MTTLGATLSNVAQSLIEIELRPNPAISQQHGFIHAGALSAIADPKQGQVRPVLQLNVGFGTLGSMIRCPISLAAVLPGVGDRERRVLPPQVMEPKMPHQSLNQLIRKLESVTTLSEHERKTILELPVRVRDFRADEDIVREGDRPSQCCLLAEGLLCRYKTLPDGTRTIMAFYVPGEIPDVHSLHIDVMDNSLGTVAPSKVAFIAHDAMKQLIHQHPRIGDAFWRDTLIDAAIFREWIVNVGGRDAYSRIAHLFCEIFLKHKAVGLTNGTSFDFPITQSKLGEATGLSTVHVNRSVQSLRTDGLIVLERGHCRIPDLERLEQAAMFDRTYLHLRSEQTGSQSLAHLDRPQSHT